PFELDETLVVTRVPARLGERTRKRSWIESTRGDGVELPFQIRTRARAVRGAVVAEPAPFATGRAHHVERREIERRGLPARPSIAHRVDGARQESIERGGDRRGRARVSELEHVELAIGHTRVREEHGRALVRRRLRETNATRDEERLHERALARGEAR